MRRLTSPTMKLRRAALLIALFGILVIALFTASLDGSSVGAQQNIPTVTPFVILPITPTPLFTLKPILGSVPISAKNAKQVKQLMQIGDGDGGAYDVCWSPDGKTLGVATTVGFWLFDATDWSKLPHPFGPTGPIIACSWSPHGKYVTLTSSGLSDRMPWFTAILRFSDGSMFKYFNKETIVQWAPDGQHFTTRDELSHRVGLWDAVTGHLLYQFDIVSLIWSPDGHFAAIIVNFGMIQIWSSAIDSIVFSDKSGWQTAFWSSSGNQLALISNGGAIALAVLNSQMLHVSLSPFLTLNGSPTSGCKDLSWSPDGTAFAAAFDNGLLVIYSANGQMMRTYNFTLPVLQVSWSPANQMIAMRIAYSATDTYFQPGYVKVIDPETGKSLFDNFSPSATVPITFIAWSRLGHYLTWIYGPSNGDLPRYMEIHPANHLLGNPVSVTDASDPLVWSPDDTQIAVVKNTFVYERKLDLLPSNPQTSKVIHKGMAFFPDVAWSPTGQYLEWKISAVDGRLLWHIPDGSVNIQPVGVNYNQFDSQVFSWGIDDSNFAVAGVRCPDFPCEGSLVFIDAINNNNNLLHLEDVQLAYSSSPQAFYLPNQLSFSRDMRFLAFDNYDAVDVWQVGDHYALVYVLNGHSNAVNTIAYSPDSKFLASGSLDKTIRLWDMASGKTIHVLSGHIAAVNRIAFSPDGSRLASASDDQTVRIWNPNTGALLKTLIGHTGAVTRVQWSPNGKLVASSSADGTIKIWDSTTGALLTTLMGHITAIDDLSWSPDGKTIASAGADATIRLWGVP